jgi:hypothetical protein
MTSNNQTQLRTSRRKFLKYSGLTLGGLALGTWGGYGLKRQSEADYQHPAYHYWRQKEKGDLSDLEYVVMCGVLAPSPHNTQPWRFHLQPNRIDLFADRARHLGAADAQRRMMVLAVGCALENMRIAAATLGYETRLEINANQGFDFDGFCASLHLKKTGGLSRQPWFDAIFARQTTRCIYDVQQPVPETFSRDLNQHNTFPGIHLAWYRRPEILAAISGLHQEAVRSWLDHERRHRDAIKWWRYTRAELEHKQDGISIFTSAAPYFIKQGMAWFLTPDVFAGDFGKQGEIDLVDEICTATPLWGMIYADTADYNARIRAGQLAERVYLEATARGYRVCPLAYVTELEAMAMKMKTLAGIPLESELLFFCRIGKGPLLEKSVRRDFGQMLI